MIEVRVLNLGAGVQSTWLYLAYMLGVLTPQIDVAIFSDVGEEPKAVYKHLNWLMSLSGPTILTPSLGRRLGDDLLAGRYGWGIPKDHEHHKHRFASIPAFTAEVEGVLKGKTKRQCTKEYKVEVIEKCVRRDVLGLMAGRTPKKGTIVTQIAGISLDEAGRARRMMRQKRAKYWRWEFPLIDLRMTRQDCITGLAHLAPGRSVPRSACTFCPFHSDAEWEELKKSPEDWARAIEIDEGLRQEGAEANRGLRQKLYLHKSCLPLVQIDFAKTIENPMTTQINLNFNEECLGMCGV